MTSRNDIHESVAESAYHEWIRFDGLGVWTYQPQVEIRLEREGQLGTVQQPWTNGFQATSTRHEYVLYYGDSPVEYHTIVGVDDSRAFVPDPQQPQSPGGTYSITPYQATLGEIVTGDVETFNAYLNRAGIVVQQ
ncbi:hypothetical protein Hrd1104_08300 [Halorhabdus sp. CBA1104]|uniref:hypothetical protein n=1 Tax=Halorhabdus sp. CBA1104 TaxID=1380432 RepID=UPI0012B1EF2E|nr:hypothetical protein [Halorhabdus sp. CBA1104]QGN07304.1 hypothetical protein Hrd1104_08300 [Halorhabdus sp. CBA1104]